MDLEGAYDALEQRGLAHAVGAQDAQHVRALVAQGQVVEDGAFGGIGEGDVVDEEFHYQFTFFL